MDIRHLETLIAVAKRGSLAAAAQALDITATAVAQRIRTLEEDLGVALIARAGRTVRPTEAGYALLAKSDAFLEAYRDLRLATDSGSVAGELRLGAISTALTGLMPDILKRLAEDHPQVRVFLEPGLSGMLYDRVQSGHLDAAVIVGPAFEPPKSMTFRPWRSEPIILLVPEAETRSDVRAILEDRPFIQYDRQQWGGRLPALYLEEMNIRPDTRYELDALDAIALLVEKGLGVSLVPDWAGNWRKTLKIRCIELPENAPSRSIGCLWVRNSPRMHLIRTFQEIADGLRA